MSTNESDHLQFRGKDMKECEQFIAAVNKHARAQGKLRDDQWIADFVAVCLAEDALQWWSLLDEETQGSWRLLRQAMMSRFRPLFYGKNGAEAEDFVFQIRQRALHVGKLDDSSWIAAFASGCFAGGALRWYSSLDSSVSGDWGSLQRAIFAQYGQGSEDPTAPVIPTPAPAAPMPAAGKSRHRGRVRVSRANDSGTYYLSKLLAGTSGQERRVNVTTLVAEALEVEYEPISACDGPQALTIPDNQIKGFNQLVMQWYSGNMTGSADFLVACGYDSSSGNGSAGSAFSGSLLKTPWKISSSMTEDVSRSIHGMSESGQHLLTVSQPSNIRHVWFRTSRVGGEIDVELFFEPV